MLNTSAGRFCLFVCVSVLAVLLSVINGPLCNVGRVCQKKGVLRFWERFEIIFWIQQNLKDFQTLHFNVFSQIWVLWLPLLQK